MANESRNTDFRRLDKTNRKQKIIDTAISLFHQKGYRSTTLDDVAKELGITKAALYNYISNKENLLSIIYMQALERIFQDIYQIETMDIPPDEKLILIIKNHLKNIIIKSVSLFYVFFTEENQLPPDAYKEIQKQKNKYNHIIEKILEEGMALGLFRKADPKLQAFGIIGMCNWIYKWYKPESGYTPRQITDHFINLLQNGFMNNDRFSDKPDSCENTHGVLKQEPIVYKKHTEKLKKQLKTLLELIEEIEKVN